MAHVSRIVALGSSMCRNLRCLEVPEGHIPWPYDSGWVRLKKPKTGSSDLRIFGSDECLEDRGPGRLNLSYFTRSGGSWEGQIPWPECSGWVPFKTLHASSEVWRVWRLEATNVSRIVSLGGSIRRILRVSEVPGRSRF